MKEKNMEDENNYYVVLNNTSTVQLGNRMVARERTVTPPAPTPTEGFYVDKDDVNGFFHLGYFLMGPS
jgi:hypothetical protein